MLIQKITPRWFLIPLLGLIYQVAPSEAQSIVAMITSLAFLSALPPWNAIKNATRTEKIIIGILTILFSVNLIWSGYRSLVEPRL